MNAHEIPSDNLEIEVIKDWSGVDNLILGVSDEGYIILVNGTYMLYETGLGNPYENYIQYDKYYCGPLNYFVSERGSDCGEYGYLNILTGEHVYELPVPVINPVNDSCDNQEYSSISLQSSTTDGITKVSQAYSLIQRKAFGYNNDNTCAAVALQVAMNYITIKHGIPLVETAWRSEYLNNGTPSAITISVKYPNAHTLHRYLVDNCGMSATLGVYGLSLKEGYDRYISNKNLSQYYVTMSWTMCPLESTIEGKVDADLPVLITTTVNTAGYLVHNMVVYGYTGTDDYENYDDLLVHTGYYTSPEISSIESLGSNYLYHTSIWISSCFATYGYYFTIGN